MSRVYLAVNWRLNNLNICCLLVSFLLGFVSFFFFFSVSRCDRVSAIFGTLW